jgi:hypothetical protein
MDQDLFDDLLNLEDTYYQDGYRLGVEDGSRAGRIEGRTFGLEKGFEKFFEMGKLHGKSQIWNARLPVSTSTSSNKTAELKAQAEMGEEGVQSNVIKMLPDNARLAKHIRTLFALTELESLSTENNEDAVSDFDDRFKRAVAKAKVIENIVGERGPEGAAQGPEADSKRSAVKLTSASTLEKNIEDFGIRKPTGS